MRMCDFRRLKTMEESSPGTRYAWRHWRKELQSYGASHQNQYVNLDFILKTHSKADWRLLEIIGIKRMYSSCSDTARPSCPREIGPG